jgi:hypothetical protein
MKRTQLYLDEETWRQLRVRAQQSGSTVSELVRQAVRKEFLGSPRQRERVLRSVVGLWSDRAQPRDYVRRLRRSTRLERLG